MIAGTLEIQMLANLARLQQDMNQAKGMVGTAVGHIERAVAVGIKALGALGVGLSAGMFVRFVDGAIEAMGAMHELSQRTGVTVETLSALALVAKQSGPSMDTVATNVQKLSKNMLEFVRDGSSKVGESFKAIGITQQQAQEGLSNMDKFLPEFARKLTEGASGGRQIAIAQELMSKSGANLLPFLIQLAEAGQLNARFSAEQARAADDFKDSQAKLAEQSSLLGIALANDVLPSLNNIATAMIKAREEGDGFWASMYRGMQVFLTGTDLHKANVEFVKKTDELMRTEAALAQLSSSVAPGVSKRMLDNVARLKDELKVLQAFRDQLEAEAAKPPPKAPPAPRTGGDITDSDAKKYLAMLEQYRKLDASGWVKLIDDQIAEYERGLAEGARLTEEFYKRKAVLDAAGQKAMFDKFDAEQDHLIAIGAAMTQDITENHKQLEEAAKLSKAAAERSAEDQKRAQVDMWRDVDRVAHDTFVSIFDSGKSAFDRLRDTLKNGLYSLLYQMTLRPFLVTIAASVAGTGAAQAAFPGVGGAGGAGNSLLSLLSTGKSAFEAATNTSFLSSLFGGASSAGLTAAGMGAGGLAGLGAGAFGLGSAATGVAGGIGLVAPGAAAIGSLGGGLGLTAGAGAGATMGAGVGGAMGAVGAALPYIGIALAAASMLGVFGSKKSPAVGTGYTFLGDYTPGSGISNFEGRGNYTAGSRSGYDILTGQDVQRKWFEDTIGPVFDEFGKLAKNLGLSTSGIGTTAFNLTTSGIGQAQDDASKPAVAAQLLNAWAEQLLPNIKDLALEGEEVIQTFIRLGDELALTDKLLEVLGKPAGTFGAVGAASLVMRDKLVQLMGGLQQAATLTQSYYENFYSDAERHAADLEMVNAALAELGLSSIPATRDQFRALVEAQNLSTTAGQEMFAALMQLAPAFAAVTTATQDAALAQNAVLDEVISKWGDVAKRLREYGDSLAGVGGVSYQSAQAQFNAVSTRARLGDIDAAMQLRDVSETFREASLQTSSTGVDYMRDIGRIRGAVAGTVSVADRHVAIAQELLTETQALRREFSEFREESNSGTMTIARYEKRLADLFERVTDNGEALRTVAA